MGSTYFVAAISTSSEKVVPLNINIAARTLLLLEVTVQQSPSLTAIAPDANATTPVAGTPVRLLPVVRWEGSTERIQGAQDLGGSACPLGRRRLEGGRTGP